MLKELPQDGQWDPQGHLPMAFDAYCRHLWMTRLGSSDMKAYYSYNQASFPRAEPGEFYEKFQGKQPDQMLTMLEKVDDDLGRYSSATFCLWHTAIHYLFQEGRYSDSEDLCHKLAKRVLGSEELDPQLFHHGQLSFDVAKTFHLLGRSQEEQAKSLNLLGRIEEAQKQLEQALLNLGTSLTQRRLRVQPGVWDPLSKSILMALISVGTALGDHNSVKVWKQQLEAIFSTV